MKTVNFSTLIEKTNRNIFRGSFLLFILIGLLLTPVVAFFLFHDPHQILTPLMSEENSAVRYESFWISDKLSSIAADSRSISVDTHLKNYLDSGSPESEKDFASVLINISRSKRVYDKLRFIDTAGDEKVRVDFEFGSPYEVQQVKLQNKSDRYFFIDAMNTRHGDVYISPLDLNEDNGMVEMPFKPMIRAAVPVYDSKNIKRGIFIINYLASDMLEKLKGIAAASRGNIMLVNSEGYWLLSNVEDDEWGFQLSERSSRKFQHDFPDEWQQISKADSGQILTDRGLFTFATQTVNSMGQANVGKFDVKIIQHVPEEQVDSIVNKRTKNLILITMITFLLTCIPAWLAARAYAGRRLIKKITEISTNYDPLTKLPNRFAFSSALEKETAEAMKYNKKLALMLIDFTDFKQINKIYGITAGDQLMTSIFEKVIELMPEKTFVGRLKNDDFAIILKNCVERSDIEKIAHKIIETASDTSAIYGKDVKAHMNIGIAMFPQDAYETFTLIKNAESALHASREQGADSFAFFSADSDQ